jgi:hypothetical protein
MGDKGAISIAQKYRKRPIGAIGASNIRVPVLVKISRPGRARFLPDSYCLALREFARAISKVNEQIRAEIAPHTAIGGQWIGDIHVAILVEIAKRNFSPGGSFSKINHLLYGKVAGAVTEVAGNEETSAILRADPARTRSRLPSLLVGDLDVIAL